MAKEHKAPKISARKHYDVLSLVTKPQEEIFSLLIDYHFRRGGEPIKSGDLLCSKEQVLKNIKTACSRNTVPLYEAKLKVEEIFSSYNFTRDECKKAMGYVKKGLQKLSQILPTCKDWNDDERKVVQTYQTLDAYFMFNSV
jgi:hypothetical protein